MILVKTLGLVWFATEPCFAGRPVQVPGRDVGEGAGAEPSPREGPGGAGPAHQTEQDTEVGDQVR